MSHFPVVVIVAAVVLVVGMNLNWWWADRPILSTHAENSVFVSASLVVISLQHHQNPCFSLLGVQPHCPAEHSYFELLLLLTGRKARAQMTMMVSMVEEEKLRSHLLSKIQKRLHLCCLR